MIKKMTNKNLLNICAIIAFLQCFLDFFIFKSELNSITSNKLVLTISFIIVSITQFISFIVIYSIIPYIFSLIVNSWRKDSFVEIKTIKKCLYLSHLISVFHILISSILIFINVNIDLFLYRVIYMNILAIIISSILFFLLKQHKVLTIKAIIISISMFAIYFSQNLLIMGGDFI